MKRLTTAFIQRLFVSVAVLVLIGGFGVVYGDLFGPSKIAGSASIILIAWPWALPQIFVGVCILWFVFQQIRQKRNSPTVSG